MTTIERELSEAQEVVARVQEGISSAWPKEVLKKMPSPVGFARSPNGDIKVICEGVVHKGKGIFRKEKRRKVAISIETMFVGIYDAFDQNPDNVKDIFLGVSGEEMDKARVMLPASILKNKYEDVAFFIKQLLELDLKDPIRVFPDSFYQYLFDSLYHEIESEIEN